MSTHRHFIRVFNLPRDTTEITLATLIKDVANVDGKVLLAKVKGEVVGWCWVCFESKGDADYARENLNGYVWNDTMLYCIV